MSILGNRVLRKEDPKFLTVGGTYVDDVRLDGAVHVTYVRSPVAHARIAAIDVEEARKAPGVIAVFSAADIDMPPAPPEMGFLNQAMSRPALADGVVRFVGEPVAAVVTEERYQGPDAAELVLVDYDPLPVAMSVEASEAQEVLLFPDLGTNVAFELAFGRDESLFDECDVVVRQRIVNQRVAPCPLEVRAAAADWKDGRLLQYSSTQAAHGTKDAIAARLGLEPDQVR
ncbi:MAG TPA: molybdopterin cofactor-binding domain-containing protein, partial [Acidimicrobiales bacterium]|nr:molybdopterin cofactor-binding domain-containing protein [Acidimicrobiales bacterium]